MIPSALEFKNVSFSYDNEPLLDQVSFQIQPREFVGIIGPNGGGKTTLLKLAMGFLKPAAGQITVFGVSPREALLKMAYVPQNLHFDREFPISVAELVLSGLLYKLTWWGGFRKEDKEKADQALEKVGLLDFKNASFGNLSGGQAQRALIARALVSQPEILILDEPTASVDLQAENEIYQLLEELKSQMTILMVTHNLKAVIERVQKVLCVQGKVLKLEPHEVCQHYAIGLYHSPLINIPAHSP